MACLANKVAIITGAASGIGRACALRFAAEGACVVVNDIAIAGAAATVDKIISDGGRAVAHGADVTSAAAVQALVDDALTRFGRLDIMFSNAGGGRPTPLHQIHPDEYRRLMGLNLDSVYHGVHAALPVMIRQGSGVFLSTTSGAGLAAVPGLAIYGAAKAGIINLMRSVAVEYGPQGIRANTISPGPMDTPALRAWLDTTSGGAVRYAQQIPLRRLGTAEDIASAAVFLASDAASFISGAVLPVDGAIHARLASPTND